MPAKRKKRHHPSPASSKNLGKEEDEKIQAEKTPGNVTTDDNIRRTSVTSKYSISSGKEEERSDSLIERLQASKTSIQMQSQTPSDESKSKEGVTSEPIDWSQIGNCWQYMMHICKELGDLDNVNEMVNRNVTQRIKLEEEVEEEITDATPSDSVCKQCRMDAEKTMLRHQGSDYVVTNFGTFPTKPATERQHEVYDLFILHLSTVPAICITCGGIYGYCDYWVPKIITVVQKSKGLTIFCCLLCPFKSRRGHNVIVHAKDHLSGKNTGLECGKCSEEIVEKSSLQSESELAQSSDASAPDEDVKSYSSRNELYSEQLRNEEPEETKKLCKACGNIMDETNVPPPTLEKEEEKVIAENSVTPVLSLLFNARELSMARSNIGRLKELEITRAAYSNEEHATDNIALKISKMVIFCEQCGNIFDVVENAIGKLKEQEERVISFFETIPEDERQFKCSIPHATSSNEDILKENMLNHLNYYRKICDKCRSENMQIADIEDTEKIKNDMYDILVFDLSTVYSECYRCNKKFLLCDSSIPKLISVAEPFAGHNENKFFYICLTCGKTNEWSFDSIHHAAMHVAGKYNGLLCDDCAELYKLLIYEEYMQPGFSDRAPSYVAIRFPEGKDTPVHCNNCGHPMGSLEDLVQMMFVLTMSDTGEPSTTYRCRVCGKSDLIREEIMSHAEDHKKYLHTMCEQCLESSK